MITPALRTLKTLAPVSALVAVPLLFAALPAAAQDEQTEAAGQGAAQQGAALREPPVEIRETHGAWEIVCLKGTENCVMQQIGKSETGGDALRARITRLEAVTADGTQIPASVELVVPLGVVLPAGLRVQVDDGEPRATRYGICLSVGCFVQDAMSEAFVADMKAGETARVIVVVPPGREITVGLSLEGFTKAFDALSPLSPEALTQSAPEGGEPAEQ